MEEDKKWAEIDDYLLDRLSPEEKAAFEARMEKDKQLKKEVELQQTMVQGMTEYKEKQDFFKMLEDSEEESKKGATTPIPSADEDKKPAENTTILRRLRPVFAVAATVALLVLAYTFFINRNQADGPQLAQTYFEWSDDKITSRLNATGLAGNITEEMIQLAGTAIEAFNSRDLDKAKLNFTSLKRSFTSQSYLAVLTDFYLGQIAWKEGQYDQALELLRPLSEVEGLPIEEDLQFYVAMNYLSKGQQQEAMPYLERISPNSNFYNKAQEILAKLK
jgi:predicted negative regulator of RcsB-dependent stress response